MEKQKINENDQKTMRKYSVVRSIPKHLDKKLNEIGDGNWKKGLHIVVKEWEIHYNDPKIKLMNDVEDIMSDLRRYYPDNHSDHFSNFPAFFMSFLKSGVPDVKYFKKEMKKDE